LNIYFIEWQYFPHNRCSF